MFESTTTRHNPLVDPLLAVWSWEIPLYLFVGGCVAGLMVLGGLALLRVARGEDGRSFFSMQAPLAAFMLLNVGMLALLLDLSHRLYVWRVYLTFQTASPMSWGSWVLLIVYAVLLVSALVRLPQSWPWLADNVPIVGRAAAALETPQRLRALGWANLGLGLGVGTYTGVLLSTMVARPLWNSAALPPLFLVSGLAAGSALMYVAAAWRGERAAPRGLIGGALFSLIQPVGTQAPAPEARATLVRLNVALLVIEGVLIALLLLNLNTSTASHAAAAALITRGPFAASFWGIDIALGIALPLALQALMLARRIPWTVVPALLVLGGGLTLRWVIVNAGQMSQILPVASFAP